MEAFGLGPLPFGWECKIEPKRGILYFINHNSKSTQWEDPRLASIATPPYHVAITQPSAYFEDTSGSRWSSPVPSLKAFSLHRRGSSPRLGGSPRIAPSPTLPRSSKRIDQSIVLQSSSSATSPVPTPRSSSRPVEEPIIAKTSSSSVAPAPTPPALLTITNLPSPLPERPVSSASHVTTLSQITTPFTSGGAGASSSYLPYDRPASARSFSSSSYIGVPPNFLASCDTETAYRTLCSLFPTAGEQHIRHLFHKYHNRANLVMSALQVAKHPLATDIASQLELLSQRHLLEAKDGDTDTVITSLPADTKSMYSPYKVNSSFGTESPARTGTPVSLLKYSNAPSSLGTQPPTRWGSPLLSMSPQLNFIKSETIKPPKSPKMKLKYLKGIFPAAEETFLLDVLQSCENNVQKASEKLTMKGFSRTPPPKPARQKWFEIKSIIRERQRAVQQQSIINMYNQSLEMPESPFPTPLPRTARPHPKLEDKSKSREYLIGKFSQLPERFIEWALEAADFEQNKAETLLQQVGPQTPDEFKPFVLGQTAGSGGVMKTGPSDGEGKKITFADTLELVVGRSAGWSPSDEIPFKFEDDIIDTPDSGYFELEIKPRKKSFIRNLFSTKTEEKDLSYLDNSVHARGPNASLARGQNPSLLKSTYLPTLGSSSCRQGPNPSLRQGPKYSAKGPNASLAKGSMWAKAKSAALASRNNNNSLPELSVEG